jgi:hypothetical protein
VKHTLLNQTTALPTLLASCFLELMPLTVYTRDFLVDSLCKRANTVQVAGDLARLDRLAKDGLSSLYANHAFMPAFQKAYQVLDQACLAALCYTVARYLISYHLQPD